jgi:hypothetical protein
MSTKAFRGSGQPSGALSSSIDELILQNEIEQVFYHEAALLDGRQYIAWLDAFAEEVTCSIEPGAVDSTFTIENRDAAARRPIAKGRRRVENFAPRNFSRS